MSDIRLESIGDQSSRGSRTSSQRIIDFATRQGLSEWRPPDFTEGNRERSSKGKLTGTILDFIHFYKGSEEYNKTRFIERNIQKIHELRKVLVSTSEFKQLEDDAKETDQIRRLISGTKDILDSCYRHSRHFNNRTDEFTHRQKKYGLAYSLYNSSLEALDEALDDSPDAPHTDLVGTMLADRKILFSAGLSFLDALDTRLNSLRTAQQAPSEVTPAQQFAIEHS